MDSPRQSEMAGIVHTKGGVGDASVLEGGRLTVMVPLFHRKKALSIPPTPPLGGGGGIRKHLLIVHISPHTERASGNINAQLCFSLSLSLSCFVVASPRARESSECVCV